MNLPRECSKTIEESKADLKFMVKIFLDIRAVNTVVYSSQAMFNGSLMM